MDNDRDEIETAGAGQNMLLAALRKHVENDMRQEAAELPERLGAAIVVDPKALVEAMIADPRGVQFAAAVWACLLVQDFEGTGAPEKILRSYGVTAFKPGLPVEVG